MKKPIALLKKIYGALPLASRVFVFIGIAALFMHIFSFLLAPAADFLGKTVGTATRALLGYASAPFPFSLAEMLLLGLPLWITFAVFLVRRYLKKGGYALRAIAFVLSLLPLLYSLFVFMLGFGYLSTPLADRLSLEKKESPSAQELYEAGRYFADEAQKELSFITFCENGESVMPLSHREMNKALREGYRALSDKYAFISVPAPTKAVLLSKPMAYTGITGVYSFFTGESNLCTYYPDFSTVFTASHEMAHAAGIAREDEANFVAFLALAESDEAYFRYSAHVNLLQYTLASLYRADRELYATLFASLSSSIKSEFRAYNLAVDEVDGSVVRDIAESVNDAYLSTMGTEGTVSYSLVVRLGVAYAQEKAAR